jgi:hypothetical protein
MIKTASGLPLTTKTWARAWEGLFAAKPTIYICMILVVAFVGLAYELRTRTIFSCQAGGYSDDRYLAYCNGANYADYEHGAFYFDLEPSAQKFARNADVLFLGNSRLQIGFSTGATADWFSAAQARYYLLGFSYFENVTFAEKLLRRIRPRARVYVINVDDFFDQSETMPVKTILHDPEAQHRYKIKRLWQRAHAPICRTLPFLCGTKFVIFRSRRTGAYYTQGAFQQTIIPVSYDQEVDKNVVNRNTAVAINFLSRFAQEKCVLLTMVPFVGTKIGDATALAKAAGVELVTPGPIDGLLTFDGYHLDHASAERWSKAFFEAAGPKITSCLAQEDTTRP